VKVTVPPFTGPAPLVTVAFNVTVCEEALNVALALLAAVVVLALLIVSECVESLLPVKPAPAL
jgi:hypothetical protein